MVRRIWNYKILMRTVGVSINGEYFEKKFEKWKIFKLRLD